MRPKSAGILLALVLCMAARSQVNTGTLLGTITDPSGAGITAAKVTATNEATGFTRSVVTNPDGTYLIPLLPIGSNYTATVEIPGFKSFVRRGIGIELNQNVRVDVQMELGQVTETVEVTGMAPLVDTHSSVKGEVVETRRLVELPLNGRNPLQLASLITGVTNISTRTALDAGNRNANYVDINGSRSNETDYQLNGIRFAGSYTNSGLNYPNPDALQEFKLITNPNSAEYGMWSGGVFSAVERSGTNQFHGSAFEFFRNDKLNARNFFAKSVPTLRQNQFGVSAGGPIIRNKLFWFASYQGLRIRNQLLASSTPLTAAERQGLITSATPVIDPLTGQPFARDAQGRYVIPLDRFNPVSLNLLNQIVPAAPPTGVLITTGSRAVEDNQISGKIDYNISTKDQVFLGGLFDRTRPNNPFYLGPYPAYGQASEKQTVFLMSVSETHTFTPSIINEARVGWSGQEELRQPVNEITPAQLGVQNWNYNYLTDQNPQSPTINVAGRFGVGSSGFAKWREGGQNYQITDMVSIQRGRHMMKAGLDFYHREHHLDANVCDTGCFTFGGNVTGSPTADFLLGQMDTVLRIRYLNHPGYKSWMRAFFFQDDWKISSRLTLNLGARYELLYPYEEYRAQHDKAIGPWNIHGGLPLPGQATYQTGIQSTVLPYAPTGLLYPGDKTPQFPDGVPNAIVPLDKTQIQPRVGFALDPTGKGRTSIRGSFGLFSNAFFVDIPAQVGQDLPFIVIQSSFLPPGNISDPYAGLLQYPKVSGNNLKTDPNFFLPFLPAAGYGWQPDFAMPRVMAMTFNVQHQITNSLMVEVGYVGKLSRHMPQTRDINTAIYGPGATFANTDARRRLEPNKLQKIDYEESNGNASFHSLQSTIRYRFSKGLSFLSSYTWSHSIDTFSTINVQCACFQDPQNIRGDRGSSDFDRRHVYRLSAVYDFPTPSGALLRNMLGGWELGWILTAQSGLPFTVYSGRDFSLTAANADRPDLVGNPYFSGGRTRGQEIAAYFNTAAFAPNQPGHYGNIGRNVFNAPGQFNSDIGLFKNFTITEAKRVQFRAEFFNAFNQTHLNAPVATLISPAFGRITSADDPRLIQLALKFEW